MDNISLVCDLLRKISLNDVLHREAYGPLSWSLQLNIALNINCSYFEVSIAYTFVIKFIFYIVPILGGMHFRYQVHFFIWFHFLGKMLPSKLYFVFLHASHDFTSKNSNRYGFHDKCCFPFRKSICSPPIVHSDLKAANILVKSFLLICMT